MVMKIMEVMTMTEIMGTRTMMNIAMTHMMRMIMATATTTMGVVTRVNTSNILNFSPLYLFFYHHNCFVSVYSCNCFSFVCRAYFVFRLCFKSTRGILKCLLFASILLDNTYFAYGGVEPPRI